MKKIWGILFFFCLSFSLAAQQKRPSYTFGFGLKYNFMIASEDGKNAYDSFFTRSIDTSEIRPSMHGLGFHIPFTMSFPITEAYKMGFGVDLTVSHQFDASMIKLLGDEGGEFKNSYERGSITLTPIFYNQLQLSANKEIYLNLSVGPVFNISFNDKFLLQVKDGSTSLFKRYDSLDSIQLNFGVYLGAGFMFKINRYIALSPEISAELFLVGQRTGKWAHPGTANRNIEWTDSPTFLMSINGVFSVIFLF